MINGEEGEIDEEFGFLRSGKIFCSNKRRRTMTMRERVVVKSEGDTTNQYHISTRILVMKMRNTILFHKKNLHIWIRSEVMTYPRPFLHL